MCVNRVHMCVNRVKSPYVVKDSLAYSQCDNYLQLQCSRISQKDYLKYKKEKYMRSTKCDAQVNYG